MITTQSLDQVNDLINDLRPCKKIVAEALKDKEFKTVLEVGCQWGESLKAIDNMYPGKMLTGLDNNLEELDIAKKLLPNIHFSWESATQLPFEDNSFDVVYTSALFCMVPPSSVEQILNEIVRVAKKYIFLVEMHSEGLITVVERDRTAANWEALFRGRGLKATKRKITTEEWDAKPWIAYGYLITADKDEKI